jgi:ribosomal protein S6--L-glutamate ligase
VGLPLVFKFDWGGEGDHVYLLKSDEDLDKALQMAKKFEKTGRTGFLVQQYVPSDNRALRVVVVGQTFVSYWRIQNSSTDHRACLAQGAVIDTKTDPDLQDAAIVCVKDFCSQAGINLAGFDLLFSSESPNKAPLFLEINYYFGRRGLGGSERFYELLGAEIQKWIDSINLSPHKG